MARVAKGASLIKNPVSVAPGFQIENVFVMAGVPKENRCTCDRDAAPAKSGGLLGKLFGR